MFSAQSLALAVAIAGVANAVTLAHDSRATTHKHLARTLPSGWAKVQCYSDLQNSRALVGYQFSSDTMTTTTCLSKCSSMGYEYAGLEFGKEVTTLFFSFLFFFSSFEILTVEICD